MERYNTDRTDEFKKIITKIDDIPNIIKNMHTPSAKLYSMNEDLTINSMKKCSADKINSLIWNSTIAGTTMKLNKCPRSAEGFSTRKCLINGLWDNPNYVDCTNSILLHLSRKIRLVLQDSEKQTYDGKVIESNLLKYSHELSVINNNGFLLAGELKITLFLIDEVVSKKLNFEKKSLTKTLSNMLFICFDNANNKEWIYTDQMITKDYFLRIIENTMNFAYENLPVCSSNNHKMMNILCNIGQLDVKSIKLNDINDSIPLDLILTITIENNCPSMNIMMLSNEEYSFNSEICENTSNYTNKQGCFLIAVFDFSKKCSNFSLDIISEMSINYTIFKYNEVSKKYTSDYSSFKNNSLLMNIFLSLKFEQTTSPMANYYDITSNKQLITKTSYIILSMIMLVVIITLLSILLFKTNNLKNENE